MTQHFKLEGYSRERKRFFEWNPGKSLIKSIRDYQRGGVLSKWAVLRHRFWSAVTGADIPLNCYIGEGFMIPHPNGIVIHPGAIIGPDCMFFQQVTIGSNGNGVPCIGWHVDIGAGAKVLGPVNVGDNARIGANSVVTSNVPAGATVAGIPARIIKKRKLYAETRDQAEHIAAARLGARTIEHWTIDMDESDNRVVVCRNFHAIEGEETIEYLDEIEPGEARRRELPARRVEHKHRAGIKRVQVSARIQA